MTDAEELRAFEKERPPFLEKRFEGAQVHHGRIDFHLAEIRIECCIQHEVAADAVLDIHAPAAE